MKSFLACILFEARTVFDAARGSSRVLSTARAWTPSWAPDGRSIAYVVKLDLPNFDSGDLRVVDLAGAERTVVDASGPAGGQLDVSTWMQIPHGLHFRPPAPRTATTTRATSCSAW